MASESELERLRSGVSALNAALENAQDDAQDEAQTPQTLAAEAVKGLGEEGLRELLTLLVGGYLQLRGGTLTGDLKVGETTVRASDGHIVLPSGVEIY